MQPADEAHVRATLTPTSRRTGLWVGGGLVLTALLALGAFGLTGSARGDATYPTETLTVGTLTIDVTTVGKLQPVDEVSVGSELSGIVREVLVEANDPVTAGQLLARLDDQVLTAQAMQTHASVDAARATLRQARVNVKAARRDLDRSAQLSEKGAVSPASHDQVQTAWEVAVASLALAEAQLNQAEASDAAAQTNLQKTRIVAPIDGVVLERNVEPGQAVVSSLQAAVLFRVARDLEQMKVEVEVDEADVGRIQPGQDADFTVAAYRDRVFDAEVTKVDLAPLSSGEVVAYGAELVVANPELLLRPGMTATADIETETLDSVLLVPNSALRFAPADRTLDPPEPREGRRVGRVWTWDGTALQPIEVLPIASDGRRTAIEAGALEPGMEVVVGPRERR